MCCSIPNTILKDVKCIGESLQKISWTLLMIKDRQNAKNLPPPYLLVLELGSLNTQKSYF